MFEHCSLPHLISRLVCMLSKHHSFTVAFFLLFWGFTEFSELRALSDMVSCFWSLCFCLAHSLDSALKPGGCGASLSGMARHMWFLIISLSSLFCLSVFILPTFPAVFLSCICLAGECEKPQTHNFLIFIVGCLVLLYFLRRFYSNWIEYLHNPTSWLLKMAKRNNFHTFFF